jgi:hypothetical protein
MLNNSGFPFSLVRVPCSRFDVGDSEMIAAETTAPVSFVTVPVGLALS